MTNENIAVELTQAEAKEIVDLLHEASGKTFKTDAALSDALFEACLRLAKIARL